MNQNGERMNSGTSMMKIDLHCHSEASWDCLTPITEIPARCAAAGISVLAITDHNEIWGAQAVKALAESDPDCDLTIIVGEEISSDAGELIGLFLTEVIPAGLSAVETAAAVHEQGGLLLLPHGFDPLKRHALNAAERELLAQQIDIVETFNARVSKPEHNDTAVRWAAAGAYLQSAGSDAHRLSDIGAAWVETPERPIVTPGDLREALARAGAPQGTWTHPVRAFIEKTWEQLGQRLTALSS